MWLDEDAEELVLFTSVVALPAVFLYRGPKVTALTSDIHLLKGVPGVHLDLDPAGVVQLGHFGHPVDHRTMFRNLELLPAGSEVRFTKKQAPRVTASWRLPELRALSWDRFLEQQIDAFEGNVRALDMTGSFLSLTAGLDTRTVFSTLAAQDRLVPGVTMTGPRRSLDARIAARLCRAYGVRHEAVVFDDRFVQSLPRFVETASRLSGGQQSLSQAPEVYLYEQIGPGFTARVSGNMGNQIGRGGTEGVSLRGADLSVLASGLRQAGAPGGHWLLEQLGRDAHSTLMFILQHEIPFTLVGNYGVGNHFARQQSPYANRALIEVLASRPATASHPMRSKLRMRLRDVRHRFLGQPTSRSFQRTLVRRIGGFASRCPVNWGWRPAGGVSPLGLAYGAATLLGMFSRATGLDAGILRGALASTGLPSLHDFREGRRWLRHDLAALTNDVLRSRSLREAEVFDWLTLDRVLVEHFEGRRDHFETVLFALDVGFAHRLFLQ
jgi:hypothetical protein